MSECGWLSDRMPAVVLGRAQWTAQEVQHLRQCGTCQQEWEVVRVAHRLGVEAGESLDLTRLASTVLSRVTRDRASERRHRRTWTFGGLAAAAAMLVALWTGALSPEVDSASPAASLAAGGALEIPLPELESLQPAELDSVLQTMDEPNGRGANTEEPDLADLNSEELERVLHSWEG